MGMNFLGEIKIVSFNFPPKNWAFCNGQLLSIQQNQALFSLFGTTYGGDGRTNFALPDLRGRVPVHPGGSAGFVQGERGGEESHVLQPSEMPSHVHTPVGSSAVATLNSPSLHVWAASGSQPYSSSVGTVAMNPAGVTNAGGSQPHNNMAPYLVLNFVVALAGIFPSRN